LFSFFWLSFSKNQPRRKRKGKGKIVIQFVEKKLLLHNAFQKILFLAKVFNLKKSIIRDEIKNPKSSITLIDDFLSLSLSHQTEKVHLKF
jgi:hypothetical protein